MVTDQKHSSDSIASKQKVIRYTKKLAKLLELDEQMLWDCLQNKVNNIVRVWHSKILLRHRDQQIILCIIRISCIFRIVCISCFFSLFIIFILLFIFCLFLLLIIFIIVSIIVIFYIIIIFRLFIIFIYVTILYKYLLYLPR